MSCVLSRMNRRVLIWLLAPALLGACAHPVPGERAPAPPTVTESFESLVARVRADPANKWLLARFMVKQRLLMIPDPHAQDLAVLPFQQNERSFVPVFSDQKTFDEEAFGTGFAGKAVPVDGRRFAELLKGDETVILNPGHRPAIEFVASELKAFAASDRP